jgi:gamma-glutamyltranspeptidase/glutathione hydrolase
VSAWTVLSQRFGKLPFDQLLAPAIGYAREGFTVSPIVSRAWAREVERYRDRAAFQAHFAPTRRAPAAGETFRSEPQAKTLEQIAATRGEAFYRGEIAQRIATCAKNEGGLMTADDLAAHQADWVDRSPSVIAASPSTRCRPTGRASRR